MDNPHLRRMLSEFVDGRTKLVFDFLTNGLGAGHKDENGVSLIQHCAYYGDVSATRFLLSHGETLDALGANFDLDCAAFHGH
ncbi:MAG: hypothetical protein ABR898_01870 [Terracidiphilus sp.]|jgi:hypothetical protein